MGCALQTAHRGKLQQWLLRAGQGKCQVVKSKLLQLSISSKGKAMPQREADLRLSHLEGKAA